MKKLLEFLKLRKLEVETNRVIRKLYPNEPNKFRTYFKDVKNNLSLILLMQGNQKRVLEEVRKQLEARK